MCLKTVRFMTMLLAVFCLYFAAAGCADEPPPYDLQIHYTDPGGTEATRAKTGTVDAAGAYGRRAMGGMKHTMAWATVALLIGLVPLLALLIPGAIFHWWEMRLEGAISLAFGIFIQFWAWDLGLGWQAIVTCCIPGFLIILWKSEHGKLALFMGAQVIYLCWLGFSTLGLWLNWLRGA